MMELEIEKYPTRRHTVQIGACPSCSFGIKVPGRLAVGAELSCPACSDELQVVGLNPVKFDWLYDYEDEYSDYDNGRR